ncbi:MAG: hypothetical protein ACE366_28490 [Bradymonadia bacterium]
MVRGSLAIGALVLGLPLVGHSRPSAPKAFCDLYTEAPKCQTGGVQCEVCHTTPPARNLYGDAVEKSMADIDLPRPLGEPEFLMALPESLRAIEMDDADGDGVSNHEEILAGSWPADATSMPDYAACDETTAARASRSDNGWNVCDFDPAYVYKKVALDFCGRSPSLEAQEDFAELVAEGGDWASVLHSQLDECLKSQFWLGKDGALWALANDKIGPTQAVKSGEDAGDIPLGDYYDDYQLWAYTQSGDRDAREVLTAQYFVTQDREDPTEFSTFTFAPTRDFARRGFDGVQLVHPDHRAGMLTTRWFLVSNTMFTSVPRTSAAVAYKAFLGYDIARMEGLDSVPGEPKDYDDKGVQRADCAVCHATLDPLTYPFASYEGLGGGEGGDALVDIGGGADLVNSDGTFNLPVATYNPDRLERFPTIDGERVVDTPEAGVLFGQPVANLQEWAQVAANSDAFARTTVKDYWTLLNGIPPQPAQAAEFEALWRAFRGEHAYRVERMLHALIMTEAYGVP